MTTVSSESKRPSVKETIKKLGPLGQILDMMPGQMGQMARQVNPQDAEKQLAQTEAELSAAMDGLREARQEAEELRSHLESMSQR